MTGGINVEVVDKPDYAMTECMGRFSIPTDRIRSDPETWMQVMARCVIVRAEQMFESGSIEYTALSYDFDKVEEGMRAPWYEWVLESQPDGTTVVLRAVRKDF
jgi:hypothetical protein